MRIPDFSSVGFEEFSFYRKSITSIGRLPVIRIVVENLVGRNFIKTRVGNFYIESTL